MADIPEDCGRHCRVVDEELKHCSCFDCHGSALRKHVRKKNPVFEARQLSVTNAEEFAGWIASRTELIIDIWWRSYSAGPNPVVVIWEGDRVRIQGQVRIGYWVIIGKGGQYKIADDAFFKAEYEVEEMDI